MTAMVALLALAGLFVAYTFVGYPLVLWLLGGRAREPDAGELPGEPPSITITIPVYNEAAQIRELVESLLALEYPADRRQILVVSDASDDGTDDIVREYAASGVELLRLDERHGKTAAENAAHPHIRGEIVINTDASIRIQPVALGRLLRRFSDTEVGVVSGRDVSVGASGEDPNAGELRYVDYEMRVRSLENRTGGIVGASGCFYGIRAHLHRVPLPAGLSRDFAAALIAKEFGYRALSADDAICIVPRTTSLRREYRRKVRTMKRGMQTLWFKRHLLNPLRHGVFAWKLFSHKLCRWLLPWAGLAALVALAVLAQESVLARWGLLATLAAAGAGFLGWGLASGERAPPSFLAAPTYFVLGNVAAVHAAAKALTGKPEGVWEPTRRDVPASP